MRKIIVSLGTLILALGIASGASQTQKTTDVATKTTINSQAEVASNTTTANTAIPQFEVTVAEAIQTFQELVPDTDITAIELGAESGQYLYKIVGVDDFKQYECQINAQTKEVVASTEEDLEEEKQNGKARQAEKLDLDNLLTIEEVTEVAMQQVRADQPLEWKLSQGFGAVYWEIKLMVNDQQTSVKVDAKNGQVLEINVDEQ